MYQKAVWMTLSLLAAFFMAIISIPFLPQASGLLFLAAGVVLAPLYEKVHWLRWWMRVLAAVVLFVVGVALVPEAVLLK